MRTTISEQQHRIAALEREPQGGVNAQGGNSSAPAEVSRPAVQSVPSQSFNPEIGLVADVTATLSENGDDVEGNDRLSVREIELIVGHDVDPYSRFDATITFSDEHEPHVEEAYLTRFGMPFDGVARLGRMRPMVGKATALHRDQLDTADEPLVVSRYLGEEGLFRTGVEFRSFLPSPLDNPVHEVALGVMEGGVGEGGSLFGTTRRYPSFYSHLKNFFELSDASDFELGGTFLLGSSDDDSSREAHALGFDVTYRYRYDSVRRIKLQSELYAQSRDEAALESEGHDHEAHADFGDHAENEHVLFNEHPFGVYALADVRLSDRWGTGLRYDYVEPVNREEFYSRNAESAWTGYFTYYQSEFARFRVQYQHLDELDGGGDDRFFLQGIFAIGVHKHAVQ